MLRRQGSPYEEYSDILLPRGGLRGHVQPSLLHSPQAAVLTTKYVPGDTVDSIFVLFHAMLIAVRSQGRCSIRVGVQFVITNRSLHTRIFHDTRYSRCGTLHSHHAIWTTSHQELQ